MKQFVLKQSLLVISLFLISAISTPALAAVVNVKPGKMVTFSQAEAGKKECRYSSASIDLPVLDVFCGLPPWGGQLPPYTMTGYDAGRNLVRAAYSNAYVPDISNVLSSAHYSSGAVYNDFKIDGTGGADNFVDAQVSVAYDLYGGILGGFSYDAEMSLVLSVEDITDAGNPLPVGTMELFKKDRSGDQALTDIAMGATQISVKGETARFQMKLRRGRTYRIWFTAGAFSTTPLISGAEVTVRAVWTDMSVGIDEDDDIAEKLELHDTDIKAKIDTHDGDIKVTLSQHDTSIQTALAAHDKAISMALMAHDVEIKSMLTQVQGDLAEIKAMLRTPQGQREGFPLKPAK